jgi:uncharacterized protein YbjT (DUF2867 family)
MAKILVIGASRGTGALCVKTALAKAHAVTAFARSPEALATDGATRVKGDFHDAASVAAAVAGHDAVIITASVQKLRTFKEQPTFFSSGTAHVIAAMKQHGVPRLVVLSALGTGDSRPLTPWLLQKLVIDGLLKIPFADHARQEQLVRDSGLAYVIARPGRLTNGPAHGRYVTTAALERVPSSISRADVADFLVASCTANDFLGRAVQLGG